MEQEIQKLKEMIIQVVDLQKEPLKIIRGDIEWIINNNQKDSGKIEFLLEQLLNFFQTEEVVFLFRKLCDYYETISLEDSKEYQKLYKNLYEEETEI